MLLNKRNRIMKKILTIIFCLFVTHTFGQQLISGKVTDEKGSPLVNASVFIAESKNGTMTDTSGHFKLTLQAKGNFKIVVSYIGYKTMAKALNTNALPSNIGFILSPVSHQLKDVIVTSKANDNWKRWGAMFTEQFIGTSAFAAHCTITNPEVIGFDYDDAKQELHAYASEPLIIRNEDLGYLVSLTLVDFTFYTSKNEVDYQGYYLFKEMEGNERKKATWEQNRLKAYSLSFMHFTRALYNDKLKEEGFEVRQFSAGNIREKERIEKLYAQKLNTYLDSAKIEKNKSLDTNQIASKIFNKDSLRYYKKILTNKSEIKMSEPLRAKDISAKSENNITLNFKDQLQVVYKKIKEPEEYYNYRNHAALTTESTTVQSSGISTSQLVMPNKQYPFTELLLEKGIPVEITENGYYNNTNLYLNGFWGWWEKMATKLPYDYEPN